MKMKTKAARGRRFPSSADPDASLCGGCGFRVLGRVREWSGGGSREAATGSELPFIEARARGEALQRREVGAGGGCAMTARDTGGGRRC